MRASHFMPRVFAALIVVFLVSGAARAAVTPYADSPVIPPGITFTNVFESSVTDPLPLFGPPTYFSTGADFDPATFASFSASTSGGGGDITDGQLNFTVEGVVNDTGTVGIDQIQLFESGDYSLFGTGTTATQASAAVSMHVAVTEIDGVAVSPIFLSPSNASTSFNLVANPGLLQPWSLGSTVDIDAALTAAGENFLVGATKIEVVIDDQLVALSEPSSVSFIAKKNFTIIVVTDVEGVIPEPAAMSLLVLGAAGTLMRRRRNR